MVICLERGADLHMAQLMPLPLTVSCSSKIHIGFTFLVPAHSGSPAHRAVKRVCVCARACVCGGDRFRAENAAATDSSGGCNVHSERTVCCRQIHERRGHGMGEQVDDGTGHRVG